ncbi:MAG: family 78 glycoside hydrolase catalytic domain [Asticcacaulis sp.]|nr:family 78 glycoside hydrolase catalytic domain [Asticcacaulis sp.]
MQISRREAAKALVVVSGVGALTAGSSVAAAANTAPRVRIEWQEQPLAIDMARPRFHWTLVAPAGVRGTRQSAFRVMISDDHGAAVFDSGRMAGKEVHFQPEADLPLRSQSRYHYKVQVWDGDGKAFPVTAGHFATGLMAREWNQGHWIAADENHPPRHAVEGRWYRVDRAQPLPLFRKTFAVTRAVALAHLCIAGLGQYDLWLDDRRLSPEGLNGAWSNYDKRVLYDAYDVTEALSQGDHRLAVALGNGFFNVEVLDGRYSKLDGTFGRPQVWLQLRIVYADGSEQLVATGTDWETRDGGTTYSSIYGGEDFDARRDDGRFGGNDWRPATIIQGPSGRLEGSTFRPMVLHSRLAPKAIAAIKPGLTVYDFGLNHSGRPAVRLVNVPAGTVVRLLPSELLMEDGTIDQQSMIGGSERGYRGIAFTYTARGDTVETWSPQFTYTGYRYLQVEGVDAGHIADVKSLFLSDDLATTGDIVCSDKRMELIHGLIRQALISNSASVLTDCPHREKLGWLEQIYLNAATAMMNRDMIRVYEKMMADIRDAQEPDGMVPTTAPEFVKFIDKAGRDTAFRDSPEWGAALILAAWSAFRLHGDTGILSSSYDAMTRRVAFLETRLGADGLLDYGLGDWYDIGPKHPGYAQLTSRKMTGTATYFAELTTLARIAGRIGKPDGDVFAQRAEALKRTLQTALFHPATSTFDTGSQTAQGMALVLGLFPEDHREKAMQVLVEDIRARDTHVSAGDIGFHYVVRALTEGGRADLLHDMLSRTDKPAYLEQISNGATALTEAWDSWREASQNHFMLGHAEIWFFQGLGGLDIDFSRDNDPVILAPQPVAGVDDQGASYRSHHGRIACRLRRTGSRWRMTAEIPPNVTAKVVLPTARVDVREGRAQVSKAHGIVSVQAVGQTLTLAVEAGIYEFSWPAGAA